MVTGRGWPLPGGKRVDDGGCRTGKMVFNFFFFLRSNGPPAGSGGLQVSYPLYFKLTNSLLYFILYAQNLHVLKQVGA